jgi:hypothetical protein
MALVPYILVLALIAVVYCSVRVGLSYRRIQARPVGFLSSFEQAEILQSKHVRRVLKGSSPSTIHVETRFKYPKGSRIIVEARVIDGNLFLSELEEQRALDLWSRRVDNAVYPPNLSMVLRESGCVVEKGFIQYGPVPFTPKSLVDGVRYLATASLGVFNIPQPEPDTGMVIPG